MSRDNARSRKPSGPFSITFGQIDILFNNAGFGRLKWLEDLDPVADIDAQIDVNLRGLIQVTRAVLPSMLSRRSGTLLIIPPWWVDWSPAV